MKNLNIEPDLNSQKEKERALELEFSVKEYEGINSFLEFMVMKSEKYLGEKFNVNADNITIFKIIEENLDKDNIGINKVISFEFTDKDEKDKIMAMLALYLDRVLKLDLIYWLSIDNNKYYKNIFKKLTPDKKEPINFYLKYKEHFNSIKPKILLSDEFKFDLYDENKTEDDTLYRIVDDYSTKIICMNVNNNYNHNNIYIKNI